MADEQEITAETLEDFAKTRAEKGDLVRAHTYRCAARTIERLEREVTALHAGMREQEPHAEVGRLIGRVVESSTSLVVVSATDATGHYRTATATHHDLRKLVAALEAARQPEPVPAPSGERYENQDGVLMVLAWAFTNNPKWEPADSIPTADLDHVHALMHGRQG